MDFERAIWELGTLIVMPRKVYRNVYFQKQTKNKWARDDPAFPILLCGLLVCSAISWSIVKNFPFIGVLGFCIKVLLRDFVLAALCASSVIWLLTNIFMTSSGMTESKIEWAYAFDLHCNGFFAIYIWLYVLQLFLLPLIIGPKWISLFLGNSLYLAAFLQYFYVVYLGLSVLPFLRRTNLFLVPLLPIVCTYILSLAGYNFGQHVLETYFG
ncbi:hypothetical protein FRC20_001816 [Serendipita sp. 405]|nr:hypothetical protein FRC16_001696 [Serendipita sp. 398]KAG8876313.1 hypothetical protein FRC20_001816 [Serendipita sp. 405]